MRVDNGVGRFGDEHDVDVADVVQFARTAFPHRDHREPDGNRLVRAHRGDRDGQRRGQRRVGEIGEVVADGPVRQYRFVLDDGGQIDRGEHHDLVAVALAQPGDGLITGHPRAVYLLPAVRAGLGLGLDAGQQPGDQFVLRFEPRLAQRDANSSDPATDGPPGRSRSRSARRAGHAAACRGAAPRRVAAHSSASSSSRSRTSVRRARSASGARESDHSSGTASVFCQPSEARSSVAVGSTSPSRPTPGTTERAVRGGTIAPI